MLYMLKINLRDSNFAHHPPGQSMAYKHYPSFFQWERENVLVSDSVFITDMHLHEVDKFKSKRKIAMLIEPPAISPHIYSFVDQNYKKFDYILTYNKELLDTGRNFLFYSACCSWITDLSQPTKTKLCSMIASSKQFTEGHRFRAEVIKEFSDKVDHFGHGFKHIESKEEGLKEYCFSIVMENNNSNYYFSEKLIDCLMTKTIPIYWGSDLSRFFDTEGIITFNSIDELHNIFKNISTTLYFNKIDAVENNFKTAQDFKIPEDWLYKKYPFLFT